MCDAKEQLRATYGDIFAKEIHIHELLYVDDILLLDIIGDALEKYMWMVINVGKQYGLQLNWKKVELMSVRSSCEVHDALGNLLNSKDQFAYLGAQINSDGRIDSELGRRLGLASADFKLLKRIWIYSNLNIDRKI